MKKRMNVLMTVAVLMLLMMGCGNTMQATNDTEFMSSEQSRPSVPSSTQSATSTPNPTKTPSPTGTPTPTTDPDAYKNWSGFYATDATIEQQINGDWYFINEGASLINIDNESEYIQDYQTIVKDEEIYIEKNSNGTYSLICGSSGYDSDGEHWNVYLIENCQLRRLNLSKLFGSDIDVKVEISDYGNAMIVETSSGLFWYDLIRDEVYQLAPGDQRCEYIMSENGKSVLYNYSVDNYTEQLWVFNGGMNELFAEEDGIFSYFMPLAISDDARSIWYYNDGALYLNNSKMYSGVGVHYNFNSTASECFFADYYAGEDGGNKYGFVKSGDYEPSLLSLSADSTIITNYGWLHDFVGEPTEPFPAKIGETFYYDTDSFRYWPVLYVDKYDNRVYQIDLDNISYPEYLFEVDSKFVDNLAYCEEQGRLYFVQDDMPCYADLYDSPILIYEMMPNTQEPLFNYYIDEITNSYHMDYNIYRSTDNRYYVINAEKNGFNEIDSLEPEYAGYLSNVECNSYNSETGEWDDVSVLRDRGYDLYLNLDAYCHFFREPFNFIAHLGLNSKYMEVCRSYNSFCAFIDMNPWVKNDLKECVLTESGLTLYEKYPEACGNYVPLTNEMAEDLRYIAQKISADPNCWLDFLVRKPSAEEMRQW